MIYYILRLAAYYFELTAANFDVNVYFANQLTLVERFENYEIGYTCFLL